MSDLVAVGRMRVALLAALAGVVLLASGCLLVATANAAVHSFEVGAYEKSLQVPAAIAAKDLAIQEEAGRADIASGLEERLQHAYAGIWFDSASSEYVVSTTSEAFEGEVSQEMGGAGLADSYRTRLVQYSWTELEATQHKLDRRLAAFLEAGLVYTSIDPRPNAVVLHIAANASALERASLARVAQTAGSAVDLSSETAPSFLGKRDSCSPQPGAMNCSAPLRGGVEIAPWGRAPNMGGICTAGFRAIGSNGSRYVITADHCNANRYAPGEEWEAWDQQQLLKWNYWGEVHYLGFTEQVSSFPSSDWTKINANGTEWDTWNQPQGWPAMVVYWPKDRYQRPAINEEYGINAEAKSIVGQGVCHSGIASGTTCGEVIQTNVTYNFGEGEPGYGLVKVKGGCYEAGDSGGPVFAANVAYGIHIGSSDQYSPCTTYAFYHEITAATANLNVTIAAVKPNAVTNAATNVGEFQATLNGTVNPNGAATTYRFEYGTTTSYGESVPAVGGSAGSGTSAVSVNATAERLEPGTTYHFRLVASNGGGTTYGSDQTFHTPGWRFMRGLSGGSTVSSWSTTIGMDLPPMATGDVNGDGKADVVSVERDNGLYRYKFGLSDGSGVPSREPVLAGMGKPTRLALGDLTGDGKADIVAVEPEGSGKYRYMLGTSSGTGISSWKQVMSEMSYPHKLALGDRPARGKLTLSLSSRRTTANTATCWAKAAAPVSSTGVRFSPTWPTRSSWTSAISTLTGKPTWSASRTNSTGNSASCWAPAAARGPPAGNR